METRLLDDQHLLDMQLVGQELWLELHPALDPPRPGDVLETSRYGRWMVERVLTTPGPHGGRQVAVTSTPAQGLRAGR